MVPILTLGHLSFNPNLSVDGGIENFKVTLFRIHMSTGGFTSVRDDLARGKKITAKYEEDDYSFDGHVIEIWQDLTDITHWWAKIAY